MAYASEIDKLEQRFRENPKGRNFAPLADAYRKAGLIDNALELCQAGLKLHPDYVSAHIVYGRCLVDKRDEAGAEQAYRRVLELDPENILALKVLADIAERGHRLDQTVEWLSRLLAVDPMNGDAAEALARAKSKAATSAKASEPLRTPMTQPDLVVERTSVETAVPATASAAPDLETFDASVDVNPAAHEAAKAEGLEVEESVELKANAGPLEGLARTLYEGSGAFKLDDAAGTVEDELPAVDLPLIMPEEMETAAAPRLSPPPPLAPPRAVERSLPAAVALSDDDGAADTAALSQAEPVVTETMAELYLKQGHPDDALRVYRALLERRPGDERLRAKVAGLAGGTPPSPRRRATPPSGQSAGAFLKQVLRGGRGVSAAEAAVPATTLDAAFAIAEPAGEPPRGAPTQPAPDAISLDWVFGDEAGRGSAPAAEPPPGGAPGAPPSGFSFDQFFNAAPAQGGAAEVAVPPPSEGAPPPTSGPKAQPAVPDEVDLDQFQAWLRGLKS